jgi:hypothetical protein
MTPPTVNAYYNRPRTISSSRQGYLQSPFYCPKADDGVNYGAIGAVVGHELTLGFDDQGQPASGAWSGLGKAHEDMPCEYKIDLSRRLVCDRARGGLRTKSRRRHAQE